MGPEMYMADIGRWGVVNPLKELGANWSPYTYAFNNRVSFTDPTGMWPDEMIGADGLTNEQWVHASRPGGSLAYTNIQKKWTQPLQNWSITVSQLAIWFEGRMNLSI